MPERKRVTWYLVCRFGDEPEHAIVWDTIDIRAGRRKSMDLVIADPEVSREHAVFRRDGDRATVEDLNTGIGTLVNGERITQHELQPGDVVSIGRMQIRYGRTEKTVRPGANVRYASELKSGLVVPARAEGGRTMLAFDADDELAVAEPAEPAASPRVARAVSADGSLEEIDDDPLGLSIDPSMLPGGSPVRDLDRELSQSGPTQAGGAPPLADLAPGGLAGERGAGQPPGGDAPDERSRRRRTLVLEVDGPAGDVDALLGAVDGRQIAFGDVAIRVKKLDFD